VQNIVIKDPGLNNYCAETKIISSMEQSLSTNLRDLYLDHFLFQRFKIKQFYQFFLFI